MSLLLVLFLIFGFWFLVSGFWFLVSLFSNAQRNESRFCNSTLKHLKCDNSLDKQKKAKTGRIQEVEKYFALSCGTECNIELNNLTRIGSINIKEEDGS